MKLSECCEGEVVGGNAAADSTLLIDANGGVEAAAAAAAAGSILLDVPCLKKKPTQSSAMRLRRVSDRRRPDRRARWVEKRKRGKTVIV